MNESRRSKVVLLRRQKFIHTQVCVWVFQERRLPLNVFFVTFEVVLRNRYNSQLNSKTTRNLKIKPEMRWLTYFSEILPSVNERAGEFTRCSVMVGGQEAGTEVKPQRFGLTQVHSLF